MGGKNSATEWGKTTLALETRRTDSHLVKGDREEFADVTRGRKKKLKNGVLPGGAGATPGLNSQEQRGAAQTANPPREGGNLATKFNAQHEKERTQTGRGREEKILSRQ